MSKVGEILDTELSDFEILRQLKNALHNTNVNTPIVNDLSQILTRLYGIYYRYYEGNRSMSDGEWGKWNTSYKYRQVLQKVPDNKIRTAYGRVAPSLQSCTSTQRDVSEAFDISEELHALEQIRALKNSLSAHRRTGNPQFK